MSEQPTIHARLLDAILEPSVRLRVSLIIDSCILAVEDLASLDQSIYRRSEAAEGGLATLDKQELEQLAKTVFDGVRKLVEYLERLDTPQGGDSSDDDDMDLDFDLAGSNPPAPEDMTLDDDDIAGALDGLAPQTAGSADKWAELSSELTSLSYALASELKEFDQRFANALGGEHFLEGLRALDDVGNSLIDGMFALMSTICEKYLGEIDRDQLLPGHRDTLGKALLVRRGLADLRRGVNERNRIVQDTEAKPEVRQAALDLLALDLGAFLDGEVFTAMRPADRLELKSFHEEISGTTVERSAMSCEGLDKYLDSLASVSQRDVLIKHDRELTNEVAELLEGVAPLIDISPHGAMDMVRQAYARAKALYGYRDDLDSLLAEWAETAEDVSDPDGYVDLGKRLAAIVGPAN